MVGVSPWYVPRRPDIVCMCSQGVSVCVYVWAGGECICARVGIEWVYVCTCEQGVSVYVTIIHVKNICNLYHIKGRNGG